MNVQRTLYLNNLHIPPGIRQANRVKVQYGDYCLQMERKANSFGDWLGVLHELDVIAGTLTVDVNDVRVDPLNKDDYDQLRVFTLALFAVMDDHDIRNVVFDEEMHPAIPDLPAYPADVDIRLLPAESDILESVGRMLGFKVETEIWRDNNQKYTLISHVSAQGPDGHEYELQYMIASRGYEFTSTNPDALPYQSSLFSGLLSVCAAVSGMKREAAEMLVYSGFTAIKARRTLGLLQQGRNITETTLRAALAETLVGFEPSHPDLARAPATPTPLDPKVQS